MPITSYNEIDERGRIAGWVDHLGLSRDIINRLVGGMARQVSTIEVDSASDDTEYTVTIAGKDVTVNSGTGATVASIAQQLLDAILGDFDLGGLVTGSRAAGVVTLTGARKGESFAISDADANLTTATTTSAATGDTIPFGVGVVMDPDVAGNCLSIDGSNMVAKVVHCTPAEVNSYPFRLGVRMLSGAYAGQTFIGQYTSDGSGTDQEIAEGIVADLNGALPANTVIASEDDTKVVLTGEIAGDDFEVVEGNNWTVAVATQATSHRFLGVSVAGQKQPVDRLGTTHYAAGEACPILRRGEIWVQFEGSDPTPGLSPVYVRRTAAGSEVAGAFRAANSDSGDCFALPPGRAEWAGVSETGTDGNTICLLRLL